MEVKKATTIDERLDILEGRGLVIEDRIRAAEVLSNVNYYVLTGYLHDFKDSEGNYEKGLTFSRVHALYQFDSALRNILLYAMEHVEQALKTHISHIIAWEYPDDPCIYESSDLFKNRLEHTDFMNIFKKTVNANKNIPFVKHYIQKYERHFPIWVAVELFTMGNLRHLYLNLPNKLRRRICSHYNISPEIMDSWLENLRITRNTLAHNMRLYGKTMMMTPKMPDRYYDEIIIRNRIFDQVRLIRILFPDSDMWSRIVDDLQTTLTDYLDVIELEKIGFPDNWRDYIE